MVFKKKLKILFITLFYIKLLMVINTQYMVSIGDGSSSLHSSSSSITTTYIPLSLFLSSFSVFIQWYNLTICEKENKKNLAYENYLKIKLEKKKREDEYKEYDMYFRKYISDAYRMLIPYDDSITIQNAIKRYEIDKLYSKEKSACIKFNDLNKTYANELTESFWMMMGIFEIIPWLNTPLLSKKEKLIKAIHNEALLINKKKNLIASEYSLLHDILKKEYVEVSDIYHMHDILKKEYFEVVGTYTIMIKEMFKLFITKFF